MPHLQFACRASWDGYDGSIYHPSATKKEKTDGEEHENRGLALVAQYSCANHPKKGNAHHPHGEVVKMLNLGRKVFHFFPNVI